MELGTATEDRFSLLRMELIGNEIEQSIDNVRILLSGPREEQVLVSGYVPVLDIGEIGTLFKVDSELSKTFDSNIEDFGA